MTPSAHSKQARRPELAIAEEAAPAPSSINLLCNLPCIPRPNHADIRKHVLDLNGNPGTQKISTKEPYSMILDGLPLEPNLRDPKIWSAWVQYASTI